MRLAWLLTLAASVALWHFHDRLPWPGERLLDRQGQVSQSSGHAKARRPDDGTLRIGTWNLRRLGHGHKRLDLIARIIDDSFDVIALQEVMSERGVDGILAALPGWKAEISPTAVGRDGYVEMYAVLYRAEYQVERSFMMADRADALVREPFVTCMRARTFDFCVASVHIVFGRGTRERDRELEALGRMLTAARARDREKDWIIAGDFNRAPGAPGWKALHRAGWQFAATERIPTSLGKREYKNAYDHILVDRRYTDELDAASTRVDMVVRACAGDFDMCRAQVSDHAPVVARFLTNRHEQDDD